MKKGTQLFYLALAAALVTILPAKAQNTWNRYLISQDFQGLTTLPSNWHKVVDTLSVYARVGDYSVGNGVLTISGSGSGNRGVEIGFDTLRNKERLFVEFDWIVNTAWIRQKNALAFYLLGSNSQKIRSTEVSDVYADVISGIYLIGTGDKFHYWNKDILGPDALRPYSEGDPIPVPVLVSGSSPYFNRAGGNQAASDTLNLAAAIEVSFTKLEYYHVSYVLNFNTKKVESFTITQKSNPANSVTVTDKPFVSKNVTDLASFGVIATRASNDGNGNSFNSTYGPLNVSLDNFTVYEKVSSLGKANVTIQYQDLDGNTAKESRVVANQEVGVKYTVADSDKVHFQNNGFYYVYDKAQTPDESVVLGADGSTITLKFRKAVITPGTYSWKGDVSNVWGELDANFTTNGTNRLAYQETNGVEFSDQSASNKSVVLSSNFDLGSGNLTVSAEGYSLSGTGLLTGSGTLVVNKSTTLDLYNDLDGGIELNSGTLEIKNIYAADKYLVSPGTTLKVSNYRFDKPIAGLGGTFTIIPSTVTPHTATISGVDTLQYSLTVAGVLSSPNSPNLPLLNNVFAGPIKIKTDSLSQSRTFVSSLDFASNKVYLGDSIRWGYGGLPINAVGEAATTINIGELTGTQKSILYGGPTTSSREINYKVGGLNTSSTFAGKLTQNASNRFSLYKVGTGTFTLSGQSPDYIGDVFVKAGGLAVTGRLGTGTTNASFEVAEVAELSGDGTIGFGTVKVYGSLHGNLKFEGSLLLWDNTVTHIQVIGSGTDHIQVAGDFTYGGKLVVTADKPSARTYQVFSANTFYEAGELGFSSLELPSNQWSFNWQTGVLSYSGNLSSIVDAEGAKEVKSVDYYSVAGNKARLEQKGVVIKKTKYADGSIFTEKIINK